jgi:replicative DNA helicase
MVAEPREAYAETRGGRIPPQDLDAERSVLGALLLKPSTLHELATSLQPEDFYRPGHAHIFEAAISLFEKNEPIDEVTVRSQLKAAGTLEAAGGTAYLASLTDSVPTAANAVHYAHIVRNRAVSRRLINAATDIVSAAYEGTGEIGQLLDQAESKIFEITASRDQRAFVPIKEVVKDTFKLIEKRYEKKETITGVATGFSDFDRMTSGLQPGDLIILAARPSMGKTALALNMAQNAAIRGKLPVALFSLEMSKEQLVMRMLAAEGRIDSSKLRGGKLGDADWPRLARAAGALAEAELYLDDSGSLTILETRAKARRLQAEKGLSMIVIDYLQLMHGRAESREREISEISRGLKSLAKELNVPVMALSQLNRSLEARQDKRPMLSDLRESGAIEQDADVICFIYRDEYYNKDSDAKGQAELIIGKQRNGPTGTVHLKFFNEYTRFENLSRE